MRKANEMDSIESSDSDVVANELFNPRPRRSQSKADAIEDVRLEEDIIAKAEGAGPRRPAMNRTPRGNEARSSESPTRA